MTLPVAKPIADDGDISRTEFLPFLTRFGDLRRRAFLWPAVTTACFCLGLLATTSHQSVFYWLCGSYISLANLYLIYLSCGKKLPFWYVFVIAAAGFVVDTLLFYPIVWAERALPQAIAPGLVEETVKALPLLLALMLGLWLSRPRGRKYGLREPLDGMLLAAASATGFALAETMLIYVPHYGQLTAIPRLLDNVFGHIAFGGSLGYFMGLAVLKHAHPRKVIAAILSGFVVANVLHDLWDVVRFYGGGLQIVSPVHYLVVAVACFIVFASMMLKARDVSPVREFLWPRSSRPPYRAPLVGQRPAFPASHLSVLDEIWLDIGGNRIPLCVGAQVMSRDIPCLKARASDEVVGDVRHHPAEPDVLVLRNLSSTTWEAVLPDGAVRDVGPAQTVRLENGTRLDFGTLNGAILVATPEVEPEAKEETEWC
jgi:RsiW-degrading membrane proteinase PrsW (M82 family)